MPDEEHAQSVPLFRAYIRRKPSGLLLVTVLSTLLPRPVFRSYPLDIGEAVAVERSVGHALESIQQRAICKSECCHDTSLKRFLAACDNPTKKESHDCCVKSHALLPTVNVVVAESLHCALPCGPEDESRNADKREEQHAAEGNGEFKQLGCGDEVEHGSQPPNFYDQIGSDKNQEAHQNEPEPSHAKTVEKRNEPIRHGSPHGLHQPCTDAAVRSEEQAGVDGYAVKGGHGSVVPCANNCEQSPHHEEQVSTPRVDLVASVAIPNQHPSNNELELIPEHEVTNPTQHLRLRVVWQGLLS